MGRYIAYGYTSIGTVISAPSVLCVTGGTTQLATQVSCTWTVPAGVTCATFEAWGGGGAGATRCCNDCYSGMPGSPGGYSVKTIAVTPGAQYTIVAGAGGNGNQPSNASPSSTSSPGGTSYVTGTGLNNFCATGGPGGYRCDVASTSGGYAIQGGIGYGGDIEVGSGYQWQSECWDLQICGLRGSQTAPMGAGNFLWVPDSSYGTSQQGNYTCNGINGAVPGGGGGPATTCCCLYTTCPGYGGNGMVKVTY